MATTEPQSSSQRPRGARCRSLAAAGVAALALCAVSAGPSAASVPGRAFASDRGASTLIRPGMAWSALSWSSASLTAGSNDVALDGSPGFPPVVDPATHTVYVPIQCTDPSSTASCNDTASHVLDLLDSATCNAALVTGCRIVARARVAAEPITATLDPRTDTVYVGSTDGTRSTGSITVVDGATCNVSVTSGCGHPLATIGLAGGFPTASALDPATGTLYVASLTGVVDVLDVSHCNAISHTSCGAPLKSINDANGPVGVDVDRATDTVYVADGANFNGTAASADTVSVINGATCNAHESSGCGQTPETVGVGVNPQWVLVAQATNTVYVANAASGSVSVIDGATCDARDTTGCAGPHRTVLTGTSDNFVALDRTRHTLFSLNQDNDTMSAIDTRACNAMDLAGCPVEAPNAQVPFNPPAGGGPNSFALDPSVGTAYLVNAGGQSLLEPVSVAGCSAQATATCRSEVGHVARNEFFPVVDAATHTLYAGDTLLPQIDVFDTHICTPAHLAACTPVAEIPSSGPQANLDAIDDTTHTLYAGDVLKTLAPIVLGDTVSVINIAHCTATDTTGCNDPQATVKVHEFPGPPVLDPVTHTLYLEEGPDEDAVAVIDTRHCNALDSSGCGATPARIPVPANSNWVDVSVATDTVYVSSTTSDAVAVIDGASCNGSDHSGCGHVAGSAPAGFNANGVLADDATHTVYVANGSFGDGRGTLSMIDTRLCNGTAPAGCARTWPQVAVGRGPQQVVLDHTTGQVVVADSNTAQVSILNGSTCNAVSPGTCAVPIPAVDTAGGPQTLAVDPSSGDVYADTGIGFLVCCGGTESMSVFALPR